MFGAKKRRKPSLFKRLFYLLMVCCGGGAGVGGWAFKDHPRVQALWTLVTGKPVDAGADAPEGDDSLVSQVVDALKPRDDFRKPGLYQVTINKVELDPVLFKPGHTVDIQARVHTVDAHGQHTILWDSRSYGERLAVVGKDTLTAGWPNRPFPLEWTPGRQFTLEVYDRKTVVFLPPKWFALASSYRAVSEFPFKTGDWPLEPGQRSDPAADPGSSHVVLKSERLGDAGQPDPAGLAERPIVIK
jgi:hypothetical protein